MCDDLEGEALATLLVNKLRGTFSALVVKAPGYGDRRKEMLADIAAVTGATVITEDLGRKLDTVTLEDLGSAHKVLSTKDHTTFVEGKGDKMAVDARVAMLRKQVEAADSDFDKEKLFERLAKLAGGVGVIKVGAATEMEMHEKKDRIDDAVAATKAAVEEGIVPGGGIALIQALVALDALKLEGEEAIGAMILRKACEAPVYAIAENAGRKGDVVVESVKASGGIKGYDAAKDEMNVDLAARGIIDPAKVTRSALQNAASVAGMFLTTECVITDLPKKEAPQAGGPDMGGMGY